MISESLIHELADQKKSGKIQFVPLEVSEVMTDSHTDYTVSIESNGEIKIKYFYDRISANDPLLVIPDIAFFTYLTQSFSNLIEPQLGGGKYDFGNAVKTIYAFAELLSNVKAGSLTAQTRLAEIRLEVLRNLYVDESIKKQLNLEIELPKLISKKEKELALLEAQSKKYKSDQQKRLDNWRAEHQILETHEAREDKLNDLILKNDRAGVGQLLRDYLPWPLMEPAEKSAWIQWVEAIEKPDWKNTRIAFRGIDYNTDKIQRDQSSAVERIGFMSTILTKNQGNYTRRLRSIGVQREKTGNPENGVKEYSLRNSSPKIADQMRNHADVPLASSFLSFSYAPSVATQFIGTKTLIRNGSTDVVPNGGILVVKMDARRLIPNLLGVPHEAELLVPLIVFPDEVLVYKEGSKEIFDEVLEEVRRKTGQNTQGINRGNEIVPGTGLSIREQYAIDGAKYFRGIMPVYKPMIRGGTCSHIFM